MFPETTIMSYFADLDDPRTGQNITHPLINLVTTATIVPFTVAETSASAVEVGVMIAFSVLLWPFARNRIVSRWESGVLFAAYLIFIIYTFVSSPAELTALIP